MAQENTKRPPHRKRRWRLWLFRFIALAILPALFLLSVEGVLRLTGYGYSDRAIVPCSVAGQKAWCDNPGFTRQYFPPPLAREFDPFLFPERKPDGTYRIFVLGASAAQGFPAGEYSFGRMLEVLLRRRHPRADFEVIVAATVAINSHAVRKIAEDCARHQPDLFVVYLGNNEVVGPYGAGTVFSPFMSSLAFLRLRQALVASRTGQLILNTAAKFKGDDGAPKVWRGMEMFLDKQVRYDDPALASVYDHFEENVRDILEIAGDAGAQTILSTVCVNLKDSPPFASLHRPGLTGEEEGQWSARYGEGIAFEEAGRWAEARDAYKAAEAIDEQFADLQFRLARCLERLSEYGMARDAYERARDLDTLRFRADSRINERIRAVGSDTEGEGVFLVDAARVFDENSAQGIPGQSFFHEHVHLNFSGNFLLAKTLFQKIETLLPPSLGGEDGTGLSPVEEEQCEEDLAYTLWDRFSIANQVVTTLITRPPFTNQLFHEDCLLKMEENLAELRSRIDADGLRQMAQIYEQAIRSAPEDWWLHWKYARLLNLGLGDIEGSLAQYKWVRDHLPLSYRFQAQYGLMLAKAGRSDAAIEANLKALELNPLCADAHYSLGLAYSQKGLNQEAARHYSEAIRIKPDHMESYSNLAILLFEDGKQEEAIRFCREGLAQAPDDLHLRFNLAVMLEREGRIDEALREAEELLKRYPDFEAAETLAVSLRSRAKEG